MKKTIKLPEQLEQLRESEAKRQKDEVNTTRGQYATLSKQWSNYLSSDQFNWMLFGTLTAQGGLTSKQISKHVEKWFEIVVKRFESTIFMEETKLKDDDLTIFWVAEANTNHFNHYIADRFHIHLLIQGSPSILKDVYLDNQYQKYNVFDVAWQMTQGRKPYIFKTDPLTGVIYKHNLSKFRVNIVKLNGGHDEGSKNRIKYCAKYVAKDMIQYGVLKASDVKRSYYSKELSRWVSSSDYEYDLVNHG